MRFPVSILPVEFACHSKACAPPPVGAGGSKASGRPLTAQQHSTLERIAKSRNGVGGATKAEASRLVKDGLVESVPGRGHGLGNTPVWKVTEAGRKVLGGDHIKTDGRRVHLQGTELEVVSQEGDVLRVRKSNGEIMRIPISMARFVDAPIREITAAEARGDSRPVSREEFHRLAAEGRKQLADFEARSSPHTGLDEHWDTIKVNAYHEVGKSWGGATIDARTGVPLPQGANLFAITVKAGHQTVSVPEGASRAEFSAAMDEAKKRFGPILERESHYLGVFHDDEHRRVDIDPVLVVRSRADVDTIGAASHSIGGAYNFSDGNGYWPPHVGEG